MAPKRRDIYRGRHRLRIPVTLIVTVLVILIVAAILLFNSLRKYAVYGKDGVTLASPGLTAEEETSSPEASSAPRTPAPVNKVEAELVIEEADYSAVDLHPGAELTAIKGKYISNAQLMAGAVGGLGTASEACSALVLEMVTPQGTLSWASSSTIAQSYGVNGQADLGELVAALKDKGYSLIAEINCCRSTLLAKRSPSLALKNAIGEPYTDEEGGWLDPYDLTVRGYLLSLAEELAEAGFDEILFSGLSFPANDAVVSYSEPHIGATTPRAAVSGLAVYLARNAPEGVRTGVMLIRSAVDGTGDPEKESPQDAELMSRIFDRLYLATDPGYFQSDAAAVSALLGEDGALRFVPVMGSAPGSDCYMLTIPD